MDEFKFLPVQGGGGGGGTITNWTTYTPTFGTTPDGSSFAPGTLGNGVIFGYWRQVGDSIDLAIRMDWGSGSSADAGYFYWSLPTGLTIDNTKYPSSGQNISLGIGSVHDFEAAVYLCAVSGWANDLTKIQMTVYKADVTNAQQNTVSTTVPAAQAAGDQFFFRIFSVPVTGL